VTSAIPAYEAIRNLLGTYCEVMDAGDFVALGALFADGRMVDHQGRRIAAGSEAVTELWTAMVRLYDGSPRIRTIVSGPVIEVDADVASCRSSFVLLQQPPDGELAPIAAGRYQDTFACTDGRWHFTERMMLLDQPGDLSRHLVDL
jgi:ketosteroid isomerase-like protein